MPFNVNNLISSLNKTGVAHNSHYEVQVTGPGETSVEQSIMLRAESIDIPGRTTQIVESRIYGPLRKIPYAGVYSDVGMIILLSEDLREREYFEQWHDKIMGTGVFNTGGYGKYNPSYYDDYKGTVTIRQFGNAGDVMSVHTLQEAYPNAIAPIQMTAAGAELAKQTISFSYKDYKSVYNRSDQAPAGASFGLSIGKAGISGFGNIPGLGNISATSGLGAVGSVNTPFGLIRKI